MQDLDVNQDLFFAISDGPNILRTAPSRSGLLWVQSSLPTKVPETAFTAPCPPLTPVTAIEKNSEGAYPCRFKVGNHEYTTIPDD